jgi:alanyl-tRNA synthetase
MPRAFCEAGVGVERLAFTGSGLDNIHQIKPLWDVAVFMMEHGLLAKSDGEEPMRRANICSDHLRGAVFAIADGARPGGNGRDHLLRTLIRRFLVRCDWRDGRVVESLPALVDMVARGNRHVLNLPAGTRQAVCDVLAAEAAFFQRSLKGGKISRDRYLRGATR